jgi:hypothetical protein
MNTLAKLKNYWLLFASIREFIEALPNPKN